jgi:hypothetical protein
VIMTLCVPKPGITGNKFLPRKQNGYIFCTHLKLMGVDFALIFTIQDQERQNQQTRNPWPK